MKFICQHCNAKYTIRDEKIQKQKTKILCKHCRGVIEINVPDDVWQKIKDKKAASKGGDASQDKPKSPTKKEDGKKAKAAPSANKGKPAAKTSTVPRPATKKDKRSKKTEPRRESKAKIPAPTSKAKASPTKTKKTNGAPAKTGKTAGSSLENKFAQSFDKSKGTPGLLDTLKQSAKTIDKDDTELVSWFVAIDDKPIGPVSARRIHQYYQTKRVTDDSLVWQEGMPDWLSLRSTKELVGLLAKIDLELSVSTPAITAEPSHPSSPKRGLFQQDSPRQEQGTPLKGVNVGVVGAHRQEAPVEEKKPEKAPIPSAAPAAAAPQAFRADADDLDSMDDEIGGIHSLSPPRTGGNRIYLIASVGFFVTAITTLGVVLFGGDEASGEPQSVKTVEKIVEKVVYRDRIIEKERERKDDENNKKVASSTVGKGRKYQKKGPPLSGGNAVTKQKKNQPMDAKTRELMERLGVSTPANRANIGNRNNRQTGAGSGAPKGTLSSAQMKSVVNKNKSALKSCYERSLKKGEASDERAIRVNFNLTVGTSGMVKQVGLSGEGARLPSLSTCLKLSVKKWVFPPSGGQSQVEFPFVFTPTH